MRSPCSAIKSALVLRGGALGDFILTLPIVRALGRAVSPREDERPGEPRVSLVADRKFVALGADKNFALDDLDLAPFFTANSKLPLRWCDYFQKYDLILSYLYDPNRIFQSNVRRCGVGMFIAGPHRMKSDTHATVQLARPLTRLGVAVDDFATQIEFSDSECQIARMNFEWPLIALHPGSGSARKNWPIENWIMLTDNLLTSGHHIVIVGGEADTKEISQVRERFGARVRYAIDWPLRRLAALLSDARFVGHDSGISHLAAAAGARCVILFGPTEPNVWAPPNKNARVLTAPGGDMNRLTLAQVSRAAGILG